MLNQKLSEGLVVLGFSVWDLSQEKHTVSSFLIGIPFAFCFVLFLIVPLGLSACAME